MKCINCGNEIPDDSLRCPDCGENLRGAGGVPMYNNAAPGTGGSVLNDKLTYAALGNKREFLTGKGQLLFSRLKVWMLVIPLILKIIFMISAMMADELDELRGIAEILKYFAMCCIPLAIPLFVRLKHLSRVKGDIQAKDYADAWRYTGKTKALISVALLWDMLTTSLIFMSIGMTIGIGNKLNILFDIVALIGMLVISQYASSAMEKIQKAASEEATMLHAAESGRTVEENNVNPYKGQSAAALLAFGYILFAIVIAILLLATENVPLVLILTVLWLAALIVWAILTSVKHSNWKQQGLWYDRQDQFYNHPETFMLPRMDFDAIIEQIKASDFTLAKTHWKTTHNGTIDFVGYRGMFRVVLSEVNSPDPNCTRLVLNFVDLVRGKGVGFGLRGFIRKKLNQDVKQYEIYMNLCATQIEQAVLRAAPNAQITLG